MKGYLDNAATAMPLECAIAAATEAMREGFGNPSSIHAMGRRAAEMLEQARRRVAVALGCTPKSVIFTSGATESTNTAIAALVHKGRHTGRHIISTQIEHDATGKPLAALKQQGYEISYISPDREGIVPAEAILGAVRPDTVLVAMQAVNNETGAIMPYQEVAKGLAESRTLLYLDAVPAFCKMDIDLTGVAMAGVSGHKIGGIKGGGALYIAQGLSMSPLLLGGGQEGGLRGGTEALPAIAAFGAACAHRTAHKETDRRRLAALNEYLLTALWQVGIDHTVNSPKASLPHIVNFSPARGRTEVYIRALEEKGVYVSGGSACAKGKKSPVLLAMKLPAPRIESALRISFCPENTTDDVDLLLEALVGAITLF